MFVDQDSCRTPSTYLLVITSSAPLLLKSGVLIIQLHSPTAIFRTFAQNLLLKFICASTSQMRVNRHRTGFCCLCLSHQATPSCITYGSATKIGIHSLGAAHTSDVVNAISASLLTSLSENTSCCTAFCRTVPSLPFLSFLLSACRICSAYQSVSY